MKRLFAVVSVVILSAYAMGCARDPGGPGWSLLSNGLGGPAHGASVQDEAGDMNTLHTPTVANKTLSAMALERATGLQPAPARLVKFD